MQTETEVKFLDVDIDAVRAKLRSCGAQLELPMRTMHRAVLDYPDRRMQTQNDGWVRVRDEGNKVTLTYKQTTEHEFGGAKEIEVEVSDYEKTVAIFKELGLVVHADQETRRETWRLGEVEVVIDEWPWLEPLIEIEGHSKKAVQDAAEQLGFDWSNAVFGSAISAYEKAYPAASDVGVRISQEPKMSFNTPIPAWLEEGK